MLEIGTHIGASTLHIASALYYQQNDKNIKARLTTVDIFDVNDPDTRRWLNFDTNLSPRQMIEEMSLQEIVQFETA